MTRSPTVTVAASVAVIIGCVGCGPANDDTSSDGSTSPYEMPYFGDCTKELAFDRQADGSQNYTSTTEYDADERAARLEHVDDDGTYEIREWSYDAAGCYLGYAGYTIESDGGLKTVTLDQTCDEHNNIVTSASAIIFGDLDNPDDRWTSDYVYTNTYQGDLLMQRDVEWYLDIESYGSFDYSYIELLSYDSDLLTLRETWDDGALSENEAWTWDAQGDLLSHEHLLIDSGDTSSEAYSYDSHGRLLTRRDESVSDDLLESRAYSWDEAAYRLTEVIKDLGDDGEPDAVWSFDCQGDWPWSCDVAYDLEDPEGGTSLDGVTDHSYVEGWSCL